MVIVVTPPVRLSAAPRHNSESPESIFTELSESSPGEALIAHVQSLQPHSGRREPTPTNCPPTPHVLLRTDARAMCAHRVIHTSVCHLKVFKQKAFPENIGCHSNYLCYEMENFIRIQTRFFYFVFLSLLAYVHFEHFLHVYNLVILSLKYPLLFLLFFVCFCFDNAEY